MVLFTGKSVTDVVTVQDIRNMTGIKTGDFEFTNVADQGLALDALLSNWVEKIASHIYVRIGREVAIEDGEFLAIQDVLVRTVANLVAIAQQQRTSPVVQINNFAINILNTGEVTKELDKELEPFIRYKQGSASGRISIFSSLEDFVDGI